MMGAQRDVRRRRVQGSWFRRGAFDGYLLLATGFSMLSGCATADRVKVESAKPVPAAAVQPPTPVPTGPSVVHYSDGRDGFVITQSSGMNAGLNAEFERASALIRQEQYGPAIELLEKIIVQAPEMTAPHINAAIAYRRIDKPDQAEEHLKKALEAIPGHPVASNEYGLLLRKAGRFVESRRIYEQALAAFPEYYPIHKNLGILCDLYLKDAACAVEHYGMYGKAMPKDQQVKLWLADLQTRSDRNYTASAGPDNGLGSH